MRIAHIVEAFTVHVDRIVQNQIRDGHEVHVITFDDGVRRGPRTLIQSGTSRSLPYGHHWGGILAVRSAIRSFKPDLVHGHYLSTSALYLAACRDFRTIGTAMGSDVLIDTRARHARLLVRASGAWIDRFTSVAPHVTRRLIELGIPAARIFTIPWGVDTAIFHPGNRPNPDGVLVSTRSFEPVYDVPTLLEAFAALVDSHREARLRLFGEGSQRRMLEGIVDRFALRSHVAFEGLKPPSVLASALREGSIYVSTALSDGASTSLLEAMASGLVPVVADIEANRSWVQDGVNGLLFRPRDPTGLFRALRRAMTDSDLMDRAYRSNPRIVEERATWSASMRSLDAVYREVIAG